MMRQDMKFIRRFLRDENGSVVLLPFALWLPVFMAIIIAGLEISAMSLRHTELERGLDATVRDVRLGTGDSFDHSTLKQKICESANVMTECNENLYLEMIPLDLRNWSEPSLSATCVDTTEEVRPAITFDAGNPNELMLLRACYKYKPITPTGVIGGSLEKDSEGYTALVSYTAFVQEPY